MLLGRTLDTPLPAVLSAAMREPCSSPRCAAGRWCWPSLASSRGRHAVTHHQGIDLLDATGAVAAAARVVDDGDVVSAGGVTSGLDLALYLLDRLLGPQIALAVEELFEFEQRGVVWRAIGPAPVGRRERRAGGCLRQVEAHHQRTPIGTQAVALEITGTNGSLAGTATGGAESVPLLDLVISGNRLRWRQRITRPLRSNPTFDVVVDQDTMSGTSKAGRLPSSRVTGTRTASRT